MTNTGFYDPPIGRAHYRQFTAPEEWHDKIKLIIGRDGCNFIKATRRSGCSYIWHHRDTHIIEIWGTPRQSDEGGTVCAKYRQKNIWILKIWIKL